MASLRTYFKADSQSSQTGAALAMRSSPENPATSLSQPAKWLTNLFSGPVTSGVSVTEDTTLGISAVWRAVRILGEGIAGLSGDVYQELANGDNQKVSNHRISRLLREPSPIYTGFTWRESMQAHAALRGNGISFIRRDGANNPIELRHVKPEFVQTKYDPNTGMLVYTYTDKEGNTISTDSSNIFHIPALVIGTDGVMGKSPITVHRESLGLSIAMTRYSAKLFKNGAHIDGFLTTDQSLGSEAAQRMGQSWKARYSGLENAGSTPVLEEGLKYVPLSLTPQDAMFVESYRLGNEDVARIFGVPLHMLASLERATFSNIEHQSREFVTYTLRPWVKRWEAEINRKLFTELEKAQGYYYRFNLESLLRGDSESRAKLIDAYMKWGITNRDEIRRLEGFNDSVDGTGKTHLVPANMVPAEMAGQFGSKTNQNNDSSIQQ